MKKILRRFNPVYWYNVCVFGSHSANAGCSVFKSASVNSAIQIHSIATAMGQTTKSQEEVIKEAERCVDVGGDFMKL